MEFLYSYGKEIVSLIVPFITWILNVGLKAKAKLIWASPHAFTFLVQQPLLDAAGKVINPTQKVCTASIKVINIGRETANKVELVFNWKPQYINLWPVRSYETKVDQDNRHMLIFDTPKKGVRSNITTFCDPRNEVMAREYKSGAYKMSQIAEHFGVHNMTVSRAVRVYEDGGI